MKRHEQTWKYLCNLINRDGEPTKTELSCQCGGPIFKRDQMDQLYNIITKQCGQVPCHKKTRIQKKWRKRWHEKIKSGLLIFPILGCRYYCLSCGDQSIYSLLAKNCIKVEPIGESNEKK